MGQGTKRRAAELFRDTAAELLDLYARRAARKGFSFRIAAHAAARGYRELLDSGLGGCGHIVGYSAGNQFSTTRPGTRSKCFTLRVETIRR